jgi:protein-S-isoprenylcysteine O-methyltransferase Ste14
LLGRERVARARGAAIDGFFIAVRAVLYMAGFVLAWGWLALRLRHLDMSHGLWLPFWTGFIGLFFLVAGSLVVLLCAAYFIFEGRGTPAPFDAPRIFVAAGPYRFVRNPMYVGAFGVLAGVGMLFRSPSVVGLTLLAAFLAHLFVVFVEEPGLQSRFGESYLTYKRATNRWIPRMPRKGPPGRRDASSP